MKSSRIESHYPGLFSMSQSITCGCELLGQVFVRKEVDPNTSPSTVHGSWLQHHRGRLKARVPAFSA